MHTLGNTQGLLSQRKRQCFSAGPNKETNSMGSHGGQSETKTVLKAKSGCNQIRPSGALRSMT
jgi:hypothetical protein